MPPPLDAEFPEIVLFVTVVVASTYEYIPPPQSPVGKFPDIVLFVIFEILRLTITPVPLLPATVLFVRFRSPYPTSMPAPPFPEIVLPFPATVIALRIVGRPVGP